MKQTTYPTEFRYHTKFDPQPWDSESDQAKGGGEEHGTLRMLEADECWEPSYPGDLGKPGCEGCSKPAMWANTPDDPTAQGYSGLCWCTACWFDPEEEQ